MCRCHTAEEIGEQVGLSRQRTNEELLPLLEDVLKAAKVTFSEEGWSPPVYNCRRYGKATDRSLGGSRGECPHFRKFPILRTPIFQLCLRRDHPIPLQSGECFCNPATDPTPVAARPPSPSVRRRLTFYASCVNTTRAANSRWKATARDYLGRVGYCIAPRRVVAGDQRPGSVLVPEDGAPPHGRS